MFESAAAFALADVLNVLDGWYPPATAESWDAVGLTCGDRAETVSRVLLAVDCVPATVAQAVSSGAQLLVTHHPLLLGGVHQVSTDQPKGALVHRMVRAGVAHFAAHTNADVAEGGVSQALAERLGLLEVSPLQPDPAEPLDHLSVLVPPESAESLLDALTAAGAGALGNYDRCSFTVEGTGTFRPLPGATPAQGDVGELSQGRELRVSVILARRSRAAVLAAMRSAHPYETVAFELTEQPRLDGSTGSGRIGQLPAPLSLAEFVEHAASRLPRTTWGVRAAGDPGRIVSRVAVCGGSGAGYTDLARRRGADAYLTSDLKHHPTIEAVTERPGEPMALVDTAHWASEAPWLDVLAARLRERLPSLDVEVSVLVTDPWTLHAH